LYQTIYPEYVRAISSKNSFKRFTCKFLVKFSAPTPAKNPGPIAQTVFAGSMLLLCVVIKKDMHIIFGVEGLP
jgi:hypothetical protein